MTTGTSEHHLTRTLLAEYPLPDEVRWGLADAGFVYATDAQMSRGVRVIAIVPEFAHDPI